MSTALPVVTGLDRAERIAELGGQLLKLLDTECSASLRLSGDTVAVLEPCRKALFTLLLLYDDEIEAARVVH